MSMSSFVYNVSFFNNLFHSVGVLLVIHTFISLIHLVMNLH